MARIWIIPHYFQVSEAMATRERMEFVEVSVCLSIGWRNHRDFLVFGAEKAQNNHSCMRA